DLPSPVAVARQRIVAVDPVADVTAAVDELPHVPPAAAVPRAVVVGPEAVVAGGGLADARARGGWERIPVRVAQQVPLGVDRATKAVDRAPQVVDRVAAGGTERKPVAVDAGEPNRVR